MATVSDSGTGLRERKGQSTGPGPGPGPDLEEFPAAVATKYAVRMTWSVKDVSFRYVAAVQHWGSLACMLIPGAIVGGTFFAHVRAIERPFYPDDPTINYEDAKDSVPAFVAVLAPALMMGFAVLFVETRLFAHRHRCLSNALAAAAHFGIDTLAAMVMTIFMQQITNLVTGVLRPDFLYRCEYNPATGECEPDGDDDWVWDGRKAFPSGHASTAFAIAVYHVVYLTWSLYYREGDVMERYFRAVSRCRSELLQAVAYVCLFTPIIVAWGIGISRIPDNKHSPGDTVGGVVLGFLFSLPGAFRGLKIWSQVVEKRLVYGGGVGAGKEGPEEEMQPEAAAAVMA